MSTFSANLAPQKPKESTPTTTVDYVVPRPSDDSESEALVKNFRNLFPQTENKIADLMAWPEGWDGYDAPKPKPASVRHARSWAEGLYRDLSIELWIKPHISADEEGDVTFEWWKGRKKITIFISPDAVEYIRVEKTGSSLDMRDGSIKTPKERLELWHWLTS